MLKKNFLFKLVLFLFCSNFLAARLPITLINGLHDFFETNKLPHASNPQWGVVAVISGLCENLRLYGNLDFKYGYQGNADARDYAKDIGADPVAKLVRILFPSPGGTFNTMADHPRNFGKNIAKDSTGAKIIAQLMAYVDDLSEVTAKTDWSKQDTPGSRLKNIKHPKKVLKTKAFSKSQAFRKVKDYWNQQISLQSDVKETILNAIADYFTDKRFQHKKFYPSTILKQSLLGFFYEHFDSARNLEGFVNEYASLKVSDYKAKKDEEKFSAQAITASTWEEKQADLQTKFELNYEEMFQLQTLSDFFESAHGYSGTQPVSNGGAQKWLLDPTTHELRIDNNSPTFPDCTETTIRHLINILCYDDDQGKLSYDHIQDPLLKEFLETYNKRDVLNRGDEEIRTAWNKIVSNRSGVDYRDNGNNIKATAMNIVHLLANLTNRQNLSIEDKPNYDDAEKETMAQALTGYCKILCGQIRIAADGTLQEAENPITKITSIEIEKNNLKFELFKNAIPVQFNFEISYQFHAALNLTINSKTPAKKVSKEGLTTKSKPFSEEILLLQNRSKKLCYQIFGKKLNDFASRAVALKVIKKNYRNQNYKLPSFLHNTTKMLIRKIDWQDWVVGESLGDPITFFDQIEGNIKNNYILQVSNWAQVEKLSENALKNINMLEIASYTLDENIELSKEVKSFLAKLIYLEVNASIKTIYGNSFPNLKNLNLLGSSIESIKGDFASLEELNLAHCKSIETINGKFPNLKSLTIEDSAFKNMDKEELLQELRAGIKVRLFYDEKNVDFSYCKNITTINGDEFSKLKTLNLSYSSINWMEGNFANLEELNLSCCKKITTINGDLFPNLKKLNLHDSSITSIEGNLANLEEMNLSVCKNITTINGDEFSKLKKLNLHDSSITSIEGNFANLEELNLSVCKNITTINGDFFSKLRILNLSNSSNAWMEGNFANLEELNLSGKNITTINGDEFSNLKKLNLSGYFIKWMEGSFSNLEELNLSCCQNITPINGDLFPNLKKLNLYGSSITSIEGNLANLEELNLARCENITTINGDSFPNLKKLNLYSFSIKSIEGNFANLEELNLEDCKNITTIDGDIFPNLKNLNLSSSGIKFIVNNFAKLKELCLLGCQLIKWISGDSFPELEVLILERSAIQFIRRFNNLKKLNLCNCQFIKTINSKDFPNVELLNLRESSVKSIEGNFASLEGLNLGDCKSIETINGKFPNLKSLTIENSAFKNMDKEDLLQKLRAGEPVCLHENECGMVQLSD